MADLRLYAYLAVLAATLLWWYCKEREISTGFAKAVFLLAAVLYLILLVPSSGGLFPLLWILVRDLAVLALVAFVGFYFADSTRLLSLAVLVLALGIRFVYFAGSSADSPGAASPPPDEGKPGDARPAAIALDPEGELLVDVKAGSQLSEIEEALEEHGAVLSRAFPDLDHEDYSDLEEYYVVDVAGEPADDLDAVIQALQATGAVDRVERNEVIALAPPRAEARRLADRGADPDLGVDDPRAGEQWGLGLLGMRAFYDQAAKLDAGVMPASLAVIAILDTGVDGGHEDLEGSYTSTEDGFDVDRVGHGTHCAGVAAAVTGNGLGIASMSPPGGGFVTVTSIKVLNDVGSGTQRGVIRGMIRAADEGAAVISLSLGGFSGHDSQAAFEEAVRYANQAGAIVTASAGNDGADASGYVPGGIAGVITVTAVDAELARAGFSNHVRQVEMGIAAPGVDVISTLPGDRYEALSGTSMATPHVAGLLGFMKALDPDLTTEEAFELLHGTGIETQDTEKTGRFIQPAAVLTAMQP